MNRLRQFWTLLQFNFLSNPFIFVYVLGFGSPPFFYSVETMSFLVPVQNAFFVGLFGVMLLAPEYLPGVWRGATTATGSDFILTRAVDRNLVARSKSVVFFGSALLLPVIMLFVAAHRGTLHARVYDHSEQQAFLASVPNSVLGPDRFGSHSVITVPSGWFFFACWHLWSVLAYGLVVQASIALIQPFHIRGYLMWTLILCLIALPLIGIFGRSPTPDEHLFFLFAAHRFWAWLAIAFVFLITQAAWERGYARCDH